MYKYIKLNKKGFTLIEISTIIVILSIIISITVPNFYLFIKNYKKDYNLSMAKNIYISSQDALNDIILNKHKVEFNKTKNNEIVEKGYDYSKDFINKNNSFIIKKNITTPLKVILANGNYINGVNYTKWDSELKKEFFDNVEIIYDYENLTMKSVLFKNELYKQ